MRCDVCGTEKKIYKVTSRGERLCKSCWNDRIKLTKEVLKAKKLLD